MVSLTKVLSKHGESAEERNDAVVAHDPFGADSLLEQYVELIAESSIVAKGLKGEYPTVVGVNALGSAWM
jgi:hypothetical protein